MSVVKPRIAYVNYLQDSASTVTFSTETAGFEASKAYDDRPNTGWLPTASGLSTITLDCGSSRIVNAFGVARSTLGDNSGTIQLFYSDTGTGGPWTSFADAISPDDERAYYQFNADGEDHQYWQVQMTSTPASQLNLLFIGSDFEVPIGDYVGKTPPFLNRKDKVEINQTQGGTFVGATLISENTSVKFSYEFMSQAFVRDVWEDFMLHARTGVWWMLWNSENRPTEASFCWPSGRMPVPKNSDNGLMTVGVVGNALPNTVTVSG